MTAPARPGPPSTSSAAAEAALILAAQSGSQDAMAELFRRYEPALNTAARRFAFRLGYEDARQAAALGLVNAVRAFDASRPSGATRLAVLLTRYATEELWAAVADNGLINVPARTLRRYFHIMRAAGNNLAAAEALAPKCDMRKETFVACHYALHPAGMPVQPERSSRFLQSSADNIADTSPAVGPHRPEAYAVSQGCVEDKILADTAFSVCSPDEEMVLRLHYGVGAYEGLPLPEVAVQLGFSLALTRRLHASGLAAAREALGAL